MKKDTRAKGFRDQITRMQQELREARQERTVMRARILNAEANLKKAYDGLQQVNKLMDANLAAIAKKYGKELREGEDILGYQLTIPMESVTGALSHYEVRAKSQEDGTYLIGAIRKVK